MRAVAQRVKQTTLKVDGKTISEIPFGLVVFLGIKVGDTQAQADYLMKKIAGLRVFEDENGKMNLSVKDVGGEVLLVSQFTLYGDTSRGNRPSFINAGAPAMANELYEYIIAECEKSVDHVQKGVFGAHMDVSLMNDGPFTIVLDSAEIM